MGPGALLMLLLFFSQHCEVFVCREQERYSLSLSAPGSRPGWNPAPKRTSRQRRRAGSHLAVPAGYFHAAAPPHRVAPAPFRGWRKAGGRRALGWSEVTATLAARRGIFLQRRHGASGGASSCACGKRPLTRILTWHLARWLAAAGTNGGPPRRCGGLQPPGQTQRQEKRGPNVCEDQVRWAQPAARKDSAPQLLLRCRE